jgi:hypothetical protein
MRNNPADVFLAGSLIVLAVIAFAAMRFAPLRPLAARV